MILSVQKAFEVLQCLAGDAERAWPLGEIAERLTLNRATCAHVLRALVELGYAEQDGPRQGYRLGPMAFALTRGARYRRDLVAAAEPVMRELAERVQETVQLLTLNRGRRFTLCHIEGGRDVRVSADVVTDSHTYQTATGRLLLAHLPEDELAAFIGEHGLPGDTWSEVRSEDDLRAALAESRRRGMVQTVTPTHVVAVGYPVRQEGRVVAGLGLYLPEYRFVGQHRADILDGMARCAETITVRLSGEMVRVRTSEKD